MNRRVACSRYEHHTNISRRHFTPRGRSSPRRRHRTGHHPRRRSGHLLRGRERRGRSPDPACPRRAGGARGPHRSLRGTGLAGLQVRTTRPGADADVARPSPLLRAHGHRARQPPLLPRPQGQGAHLRAPRHRALRRRPRRRPARDGGGRRRALPLRSQELARTWAHARGHLVGCPRGARAAGQRPPTWSHVESERNAGGTWATSQTPLSLRRKACPAACISRARIA